MSKIKENGEKYMKNIIVLLLTSLLFLGCSSNGAQKQNIEPKLVVGNTLENLTLKDQFGKEHNIKADTYRLVFAFSKEPAHTCNNFFNAKDKDYLTKHHTQFIADVSAAPSVIRNLFILPGLKDFQYTVLIMDDEKVAAPFRVNMDPEKIAIVYIINKKIDKITVLKTEDELKKELEDDSMFSTLVPMLNQAIDTTSKMMK